MRWKFFLVTNSASRISVFFHAAKISEKIVNPARFCAVLMGQSVKSLKK